MQEIFIVVYWKDFIDEIIWMRLVLNVMLFIEWNMGYYPIYEYSHNSAYKNNNGIK